MKRRLLLCIVFLLAFNSLRAQHNQEEYLQPSETDSIITKYLEKEDYQQALPYLLQVVDKKMKTSTLDTLLAEDLNKIAFCYLNLGYTQEALGYSETALNVIEKTLGKEHIEYANYLWNLSYTYSMAGEHIKALDFGKKAFKQIWKEKADNLDYADYALTLAGYHSVMGEYTESINLALEAKDIIEKNVGKMHPFYLKALEYLSDSYSVAQQYDKSFQFASEIYNIAKSLYTKEEVEYAGALNILALSNFDLGNYEEFFNQEVEALNIYKRAEGRSSLAYAAILANLANAYSHQGQYAKAIRYKTESLVIKENFMGKDHFDYLNEMALLAQWYKKIGKYQEARETMTDILNRLEKKYGKNYWYIKRLNDLGEIHLDFGYINKALEAHQKAFQLLDSLSKTNTPEYVRSLTFLSHYLANNNEDFKKAAVYQEEACAIYQKFYEEGSCQSEYIQSLNNLSLCYFFLDEKEKARTMNKNAVEISKEVYGDNYPEMGTLLKTAFCFSVETDSAKRSMQQDKEGEKYLIKYIDYEIQQLKKNLSELTAKERAQYFKLFSESFYRDMAAFVWDIDSAIPAFYNSVLFSRSILLNSDIQLNKIIQESNDSALLATYHSFKSNKKNLRNLYAMPLKDRKVDVDSLEKATEGLEKLLLQGSQAYGDYTRKLEVNYRNVQAALGDKDMSVEFIRIHTDSTWVIMAIILKKGMKIPEYKLVFTENKFRTVPPEEYYVTPRLQQIVWEPLRKYLNNVENIYFAPDGILHNIAIEYLPIDDKTLMSSKYNLYRLSSTRELALKKESRLNGKTVLFGGLEYDADIIDNSESHVPAKTWLSDTSLNRVMVDSLSCRGGVQYLDGTETEVKNIANTLLERQIPYELFTDIYGTEESFKKMSGKKYSLLHIATHGFYWEERDIKTKKQNLSFLNYGNDNNDKNYEERALTRSGLLLSGANHILRNEKIPSDREDGVLTALELSQLDFRNLDLVVLSACQTGLGDMNSDGVFGLQRGFKKAGAQTLLMSLWKVNDEATQILMTEFYRYLFQGNKKHDAFIKAQQYLRTCQNGKYDKPEYWAAFIMLDGMN